MRRGSCWPGKRDGTHSNRSEWAPVRRLHSIPAPISLVCRHPLQGYAVTRYKRYVVTDWAAKMYSASKACSGKT